MCPYSLLCADKVMENSCDIHFKSIVKLQKNVLATSDELMVFFPTTQKYSDEINFLQYNPTYQKY